MSSPPPPPVEAMEQNSLSLFLLTFNCGKKKQSPSDVKDFVVPHLPKGTSPPSLIVLGFEELAPIMDGCFNTVDDYLESFLKGINDAISATYYQRYHRLGKSLKGTLGVVVLALENNVHSNKVLVANTGVGYFKSSLKGGAGIRIQLTKPVETELTFVNAHLAANEGMTAQRNLDFLCIAQGLDFGDGYALYKPNSHTFFMGDLNYRAKSNLVRSESSPTASTEANEVSDRLLTDISDEQFKSNDELTIEHENGLVLFNFKEAEVTFPPTYKFVVGTDKYATKRIPSWCDRIFYLNYSSEIGPKILDYNYIKEARTSDHKPVYLSLEIPEKYPQNPLTPDLFLDNGKKDIYLGKYTYQYVTNAYGNAADSAIGWGLYVTGTPRGRTYGAYGLAAVVVVYLVYFFFW